MKRVGYIEGSPAKSPIFLLVMAVVIGVAAGSVYQSAASLQGNVFVHQYFAPIYPGISVAGYEIGCFAFSAMFTAAAFLGGTCALGQPFAVLLLVYRGAGIGASASFIYELEGRGAITDILLLVLPKAVCVTFVTVLTVREMLRASNYTLSCWLPDVMHDRKAVDIKLYGIKFVVILFLLMIISVGDLVINLVFAR